MIQFLTECFSLQHLSGKLDKKNVLAPTTKISGSNTIPTDIEKQSFMATHVEQHLITKSNSHEVLSGKDASDFVLKPMTEGGSKLHTGKDIQEFLEQSANETEYSKT